MKFYVTLACVALAIILSHAQAQGYNPALYQGWSGTCSCDEIEPTKPGLLCSAPTQSRDESTCSYTECINECDSDLDCAGEFEICCCQNCGRKCQPGMSIPLPPANKTDYASSATISKPGTCPLSDPNRNCAVYYDQCKSDCNCPESQKCCLQNGCGLECKEADKTGVKPTCQTKRFPHTKDGKCPSPSDIPCFTCNDNCVSDCECKDNLICCDQPGCGNQCKPPV